MARQYLCQDQGLFSTEQKLNNCIRIQSSSALPVLTYKAYVSDLSMEGRPLCSYDFQGQWQLCGWGQWRVTPPWTDSSREHLGPWAALGSCSLWSSAPPDPQWARMQKLYFTGFLHLNLHTWESRTWRTWRNPAAFVDPGTCRVTERAFKREKRAFKSLLKLFLKLSGNASLFFIKILLRDFV